MKKLTKKLIASFERSDEAIERLIFATIQQGVRAESFSDIANHGAQNGFPAITYYSDTCAFYNTHKDDIWEFAVEQAESFGNANVFEMIGAFSGAKNVSDCTRFENLMTWYVVEEVSRYCIDNFTVPEYA